MITSQIYTKNFGNPKKVKTTFCTKDCEFKCRNREQVTELVVLAFPNKHTKTEMSEKVPQKQVNRNTLTSPSPILFQIIKHLL